MRVAPEAICSRQQGFSTGRPPTNRGTECELACPISDGFSAGSLPLVGIAPDFARWGKIQLATASRVNSFRKEEVLTNWQSCSLEAAGRAAKGTVFCFGQTCGRSLYPPSIPRGGVAVIALAPSDEVRKIHAQCPALGGGPIVRVLTVLRPLRCAKRPPSSSSWQNGKVPEILQEDSSTGHYSKRPPNPPEISRRTRKPLVGKRREIMACYLPKSDFEGCAYSVNSTNKCAPNPSTRVRQPWLPPHGQISTTRPCILIYREPKLRDE